MAPRYIGTKLAIGYLPNAEGDLYTVPADTRVILTRIDLFQTNAAQQDVIIRIDHGGTVITLDVSNDLAQNCRVELYDLGKVLNAGDKIRGETQTSSAVRYELYGAVESTL